MLKILKFFVEDPDPGSGALLTMDLNSEIEKFGIRDKHLGFEINIPDPQHWFLVGTVGMLCGTGLVFYRIEALLLLSS